jgi:tetratricopeptide (TPR) repeat protein
MMPKNGLMTVVLLLVLFHSILVSAVNRDFTKGQNLLKQGKFQPAEKALLKALKSSQDPSEIQQIRCALADTYSGMGNPDKAFTVYREGLGRPGGSCAEDGITKLSSLMPVTNRELKKEILKLCEEGDRYLGYNDLKASLEKYLSVTAKAGYYLPARLKAGIIYFRLNSLKQAESELELAVLTGDTNAWFILGRCYEMLDRDDLRALECYLHSGSLGSGFITPISNSLMLASSAYTALTNKRYADAEAGYLKALALRPLSAPLYVALGHVYQAMQKDNNAMLQYQKAVMVAPALGAGYYELVKLLAGKKDKQQAKVWFERGKAFLGEEQKNELETLLK